MFLHAHVTLCNVVFPVVIPGVDVHKIEMKQRESELSKKTCKFYLIRVVKNILSTRRI